ncbi:MAG: YabP/YqfC family sporulation protein, partial [Clostridia bacterium]|nr:YabP/YqfC family sporulation protein [Clostridia bacterium]
EFPRVTVTAGRRVLLEGHKGLFSYDTRCIRIRCGAGLVTVRGEELVIGHFGPEDMMIEGKVKAVEWEGRDE